MEALTIFVIIIGLCTFALSVLESERLSSITIITILMITGGFIFALLAHLMIDRYYKIKNKVNQLEKNAKKTNENFKISKRLSVLEARMDDLIRKK